MTTEASVREDIRELLDEQSWDEILERLTLYARKQLRTLVWRGVTGDPVPGGTEAADLAAEAIADVYAGVRQWEPDTCPDLLQYLYGVVRSSISNACTAAENTRERREDPEFEPIAMDRDDDFLCGFLTEIENEPELVKVVELMMDGYEGRAEIAARMGLDPSDITNLQKKMKRRLRDYISALQRA